MNPLYTDAAVNSHHASSVEIYLFEIVDIISICIYILIKQSTWGCFKDEPGKLS